MVQKQISLSPSQEAKRQLKAQATAAREKANKQIANINAKSKSAKNPKELRNFQIERERVRKTRDNTVSRSKSPVSRVTKTAEVAVGRVVGEIRKRIK